jgi:hypothetical protein
MEGQELSGCMSRTAGASAAALAGRLLQQALALEEVQARAAAVGALEWESPAGWNFREYLAERSRTLGSAAELIRRAARLADLHAAELCGGHTAGASGEADQSAWGRR